MVVTMTGVEADMNVDADTDAEEFVTLRHYSIRM